MKSYTFITGNENKAREFSIMVDMDIPHVKIDLDEIQSLSIEEVSRVKAKTAYDILKKPVIVEDVSFVMEALGQLPGPFIKFFLDSIGNEGLCRIAKDKNNQKAVAEVCYVLYDGTDCTVFSEKMNGLVSIDPIGDGGYGWDKIFIPEGHSLTWAQMDEKERMETRLKKNACREIHDFLTNK